MLGEKGKIAGYALEKVLNGGFSPSNRFQIQSPPEAKHRPVNPAHIIILSDSAGGGLTLAFLQVLLHILKFLSCCSQPTVTQGLGNSEVYKPLVNASKLPG